MKLKIKKKKIPLNMEGNSVSVLTPRRLLLLHSSSPGWKLSNPWGQNWVPRLSLKTELFERNRWDLECKSERNKKKKYIYINITQSIRLEETIEIFVSPIGFAFHFFPYITIKLSISNILNAHINFIQFTSPPSV